MIPIERWNVRELFDSITDAVYTLDHEWRITYANRPALEFFGMERGDLEGRHFWDFFAFARGGVFAAAVERVMRNGGSQTVEALSAFRPGHWIELRAYAFTHGVAVYLLDVTEHRLAEIKAREALEQLRLITDALPALIAYVDTDHRYRFNNRAYLDWFGVDPADAVGRHVSEVIGEPAYEKLRPLLDRALAGETVTYDTVIPFAGGARHATATYVPDRTPDGTVRGLAAIALDVSGRRRAERIDEEYNRRIEQILEGTTDAFAAIDTDWRFSYVNARAAAMMGIPRQEAIGRTLWELFPWAEETSFGQRFRQAVSEQQPMHFEETNERSGTTLEVHLYPSPDGLGIYFRDISGRIRIERDLRAAEERYRTFIQQSSEGIWRFEFDEPPDIMLAPDEQIEQIYRWGYLAECNDAFARMYGFERAEEIVGTRLPDFLIREDPTNVAYLNAAIASDYRLSDAESVERDREGNTRYYLNNLLGIVRDRRLLRVWGTQRDITDQRRIEDEREQLFSAERAARAEAEKANRVKDEFLSNLSHELRTPLNAILGWSQLLRSEDSLSAEVRQGLEVIERNARSQTRIVEDLLDMSRIVTGKVRLDIQRVDPRLFIERALETIAPAADAKGLRLHSTLDAGAGMITGDPSRLQQVVWNLLSNAVKFTQHGGAVHVSLEQVGTTIEITVADTGIGIRPEFIPHIFERFRQADSSSTRLHGGLGLGLAIVKQLVELHGGTVRARSAGELAGARFTVTLPTATTHEPEADGAAIARDDAAQEADPDRERLRGLKVLVVDDEPDARELLRRVFLECNAIVETAGSSIEALERMAELRPDILISDIGMPGEDGYALIGRVRSLPREEGGETPAIALTAFARSEDRRRAMLAGYQMHVTKPVEPSELITIVASLTGRIRKPDDRAT